MIGAILGDIVGSRFEWEENKRKDFTFLTPECHFTDDSLMTLAVAEAFIAKRGGWKEPDFREYVVSCMVRMGRKYCCMNTWGSRFYFWFMGAHRPYHSYGNGAAMRVSPVGWIAESEEDVKYYSRIVTEVSHDHPEGIKGAEAVAMAIYLARVGTPMTEIRRRMIEYYPQIADMTVDGIRRQYETESSAWQVSCQGSVPQAIVCFLESESLEDAIRNAVSLGGDTDTQGCMAGAIAEAYYGITPELVEKAVEYLSDNLRFIYYAFSQIGVDRAAGETPTERDSVSREDSFSLLEEDR